MSTYALRTTIVGNRKPQFRLYLEGHHPRLVAKLDLLVLWSNAKEEAGRIAIDDAMAEEAAAEAVLQKIDQGIAINASSGAKRQRVLAMTSTAFDDLVIPHEEWMLQTDSLREERSSNSSRFVDWLIGK